jgi:hypothetical protein
MSALFTVQFAVYHYPHRARPGTPGECVKRPIAQDLDPVQGLTRDRRSICLDTEVPGDRAPKRPIPALELGVEVTASVALAARAQAVRAVRSELLV